MEPIVGYSQAVRIGSYIFVSETTATNEGGKIIGHDNPYLQTVNTIRNIEKQHCKEQTLLLMIYVRTRIYVTNIDYW
jgi:enamine deaminase RidA (YjgF/YER057c/UK114 family)